MNALNYLKVGFEGKDGRFSIRRTLGSLCIIVGLALTSRVSILCADKIAEQTMLIAPLFATGLAFFGITGYFEMKGENKEQKKEENGD